MIPFYLGVRRLRLAAFAKTESAVGRGFTGRDAWTFLYLGFFGVSVNQFCFTLGLHYTSVSHSAVIVGMGPIYTLILAVLLRLERATWHKAVGMAIAFTGIAVLASEHGISAHSASLLGDAITMTGSVGFAIYAVLGKRVAGEYDALTMTAYNHFAGALDIASAGCASSLDAARGGELASRSLGGVGRDIVHGAVWVGGGVSVVLLAATVFGGFAVECVYVFAAGAGDDSGDFDAG